MENNHITNQDATAEFVDMVLGKEYQGQIPAEARDKALHEIDENIAKAIADKLDREHLIVYDVLLEDENTTAETFQKFFVDAGISTEKIVADVYANFIKEHAGGKNE